MKCWFSSENSIETDVYSLYASFEIGAVGRSSICKVEIAQY